MASIAALKSSETSRVESLWSMEFNIYSVVGKERFQLSGCVYKWNDLGRSENRWRRDAEFKIGRDAQRALKYCSHLR